MVGFSAAAASPFPVAATAGGATGGFVSDAAAGIPGVGIVVSILLKGCCGLEWEADNRRRRCFR